MRYTHYVVSGVRIPHSPQSVEFGKLNKRQKEMRVFALIFLCGLQYLLRIYFQKGTMVHKKKGFQPFPLDFVQLEELQLCKDAAGRLQGFRGGRAQRGRCPRIPHSPNPLHMQPCVGTGAGTGIERSDRVGVPQIGLNEQTQELVLRFLFKCVKIFNHNG